MSSGAAAITAPIARPISRGLESIGISDPTTRGGIAGSLAGSLLGGPVGSLLGGAGGIDAANNLERRREAAERDSEAGRLQFNDEVFRLAEGLSGQIANRPDVDFESIGFAGGDSRQEELTQLLNIFTQRRQEIQQAQAQPGSSQTRLSLLG